MVPSDIERALDDRAGDPDVLRKPVELDLLRADREEDAPPRPLRPGDFLRRLGVAAGRRGTGDLPGVHEPGDPPEVARGLETETELSGRRAVMEQAHGEPREGRGRGAATSPFRWGRPSSHLPRSSEGLSSRARVGSARGGGSS